MYINAIYFLIFFQNRELQIMRKLEHQNIVKLKDDGGLNNIAPTVLEIMGLEIPKEMDKSLFKV